MTPERRDAALAYTRRGYFVTPTLGKKPVRDAWQNSRLTEDEVIATFRGTHNVGVVLAPSGLADVDFDDETAIRALELMDPPELRGAARFEHVGRPHLIVKANVPTRQFKRADLTTLIELRCEGAQTIFPPSIHPDGQSYTWFDDCEPCEVDPRRLETIAQMIATAAYASEFWKPHSRHALALSLAGFLARQLAASDVAAVVRAAGSIAGDEELDDRLLAVETTVQRLEAGEAATGLPTLEAIAPDLARALASWWGRPNPDLCLKEEAEEDASRSRRSAADRLVDYALASDAEFFHDEREEPVVAFVVEGRRQIHGLSSRQTKRWLARLNWQEEHKAVSGEILTSALTSLSSFAVFDGPQHALNVRIARAEGAFWYDLGDWRAVRIDTSGWKVVDVPPILFRHFPHQRAQPEPCRGGNLRDVLALVNVRDLAQQLLLQVYLVSALVQGIPRPVIVVHGEHGSGKSSFFFLLRELLDRSLLRPQTAPDSIREFVQAASHNLCLFLDNVSYLPDWLSDALCRLCTGDGFSKRQLYTDDEDVVYNLRGLGGVNGINLVAARPDLLDRALIFTLEELRETERRTEQEWLAEFERLRPSLLGAMFDALSAAIRTVGDVRLEALPRMADFAQWGCAVARHLRADDAEFLAALGVNATAQNETAVENSPVAQAVIRLVEVYGSWQDTPAATLQHLTSIATELQFDTRARAFPKGPQHLTRRLNEVKPNLKRLGVSISSSRTGNQRLISIRGAESSVISVIEPDAAVTKDVTAVTDDGGIEVGSESLLAPHDASDGNDATSVAAAVDEWEVP